MSQARSHLLAIAFVRRVIHDTFGDFVTLAARTHTDRYREIEASVRRRNKTPVHDLLNLEEAVKQMVPESRRDEVTRALTTLSNAYTDELVVRETVYSIGVAVGTLSEAMSSGRFDRIVSSGTHRRSTERVDARRHS